MRFWFEYEILEIDALYEAINQKSTIKKNFRKTCQKASSRVEELDKLKGGKFMLSALLKSQKELQTRRELIEAELPQMSESVVYS